MSRPAGDNEPHEDAQETERLRALEERLRRLRWPEPRPGVRERTLEELRRKLEETEGLSDAEEPPRRRRAH